MDADMGGTEIKAALESVFTSRKIDRPTSLFVLTDGDVRSSFEGSPSLR